jgi:hypothetical protein
VGGPDEVGMVGQAQVVVRAEIKYVTGFGPGRKRHLDPGLLAGKDPSFLFVQSRVLDLYQFLVEIVFL